jgi:protein-S-isoprenylcysteine O-methyltransferase
MKTLAASLLGMTFGLSELGLALFKRARAADARIADQGSLRWLWVIIVVSVFSAFSLARLMPSLGLEPAALLVDLGLLLFAAGLALRWYAIAYLGRFFTVDVAIATDHRLIDTGPYQSVRHPSYTGALMAFAGLGLCLHNAASLVVVTVPVLWVFARRMRIEEDALTAALGESYRDYMQRTRRLIPGIY